MPLPRDQLSALYSRLFPVVGVSWSGTQRDFYLKELDQAFVGTLEIIGAPAQQFYSDLRQISDDLDKLNALIAVFKLIHPDKQEIVELEDFSQPDPQHGGTATQPSCRDRFGLVLLDRQSLQNELDELIDQAQQVDSKRFRGWALSVQGESESGKSYCLNFIRQQAEALGVSLWPIDIRAQGLRQYNASDLAKDLASAAGVLDEPPEKANPDPRWARELHRWLLPRLDTDTPVWIVLDHFTDPGVTEATRQLVKQLASSAIDRMIPPLIVLDFEAPDSADELPKEVRRETLTLPDKMSVETYFACRFREVNPGIDDSQLSQFVETACDAVYEEVADSHSVTELGNALRQVDDEFTTIVARTSA